MPHPFELRRDPCEDVKCNWLAQVHGTVAVGPVPRTVLQVTACRRVELKKLHIQIPGIQAGCRVDVLLAYQMPITGLRLWKIAGVLRAVVSKQDFAGVWHPENIVGHKSWECHVDGERDYWSAGMVGKRIRERLYLEKGQALGVIVATTLPAVCRGHLGGD